MYMIPKAFALSERKQTEHTKPRACALGYDLNGPVGRFIFNYDYRVSSFVVRGFRPSARVVRTTGPAFLPARRMTIAEPFQRWR